MNVLPHDSDPLKNEIIVQELAYGMESKYLEGELTFADGTLPTTEFILYPCPNGKSNLLKQIKTISTASTKSMISTKNTKTTGGNISDPPSSGTILTITSNNVTVSRNTNTKDRLFDLNNTNQNSCWRSGKHQSSSIITVEIPPPQLGSNRWFRLELFASDHNTHNPENISIFAGDNLSNLTLINTIVPIFGNYWCEIASMKLFSSKLKTFPKFVNIELKSKTNDIKISRLRFVIEGLPDVTPLCVGDRVILNDSFIG